MSGPKVTGQENLKGPMDLHCSNLQGIIGVGLAMLETVYHDQLRIPLRMLTRSERAEYEEIQ